MKQEDIIKLGYKVEDVHQARFLIEGIINAAEAMGVPPRNLALTCAIGLSAFPTMTREEKKTLALTLIDHVEDNVIPRIDKVVGRSNAAPNN